MNLSLIIVSYNTRDYLEECLKSIYDTLQDIAFEVILVDNASVDGSVALVQNKYPQVRLLAKETNTGFGRANNSGFNISCGDYVMLLNSDAALLPGTAAALLDFLEEHPQAGAVGPAVYLPDGKLQTRICGNLPSLCTLFNESFFLSRLFPRLALFPGLHREGLSAPVTEVGWISGVCMLFRREAYRQVNGFDPDFFLYAEDIDICLRLKNLGWPVYHMHKIAIRHHRGGSCQSDREKIANSVLQQRHLLKVFAKNAASWKMLPARVIISVGLILRLIMAAAGAAAGKNGYRILLASSWRRLQDVFRAEAG